MKTKLSVFFVVFCTAFEVLEYYSQRLKSVTSCFGEAVGNAVITSLASGHRALSLAGPLLMKDKSASQSCEYSIPNVTLFFSSSLFGRIIPYL